MSEIIRQGFVQTEAVTGKTREEQLQTIFNRLLVKNQELHQDAQSAVDGEGRNIIINKHTFTRTDPGAGPATAVVQIGEDVKTTEYGTVITRLETAGSTQYAIQNRTTETFEVSFNTVTNGSHTFSWMIVY